MNEEDILKRLERAVDKLVDLDSFLFETNANERSITHRLAVYLENEFPCYNVDCEYNRRDGRTKQVMLLPKKETKYDDLEATTVYPDIIVHRRGSDGHNLLIIEAKKSTGSEYSWDRKKLDAYRRDLDYTVAVFLTFSIGSGKARCNTDLIPKPSDPIHIES